MVEKWGRAKAAEQGRLGTRERASPLALDDPFR